MPQINNPLFSPEQFEWLKNWITETIEEYGQAEVTWRVLQECLRDPIEEVMDKKTGITWHDISLFTGKPSKTATERFEEWLKEKSYEYHDTNQQSRCFYPLRQVDRSRNQHAP